MMKKLLMMAFAVLGLATTAMAQDATTVSIIGADGDTLKTAELATIDKVEFADSSAYVIMTTEDGAADTLTLVRKNVDKLLFSVPATATAIKAAPAVASGKVTIAAKGSQLSVAGVKAGTAIAVFDVNGRLATQVKATSEAVSLDATSLKPGLYIVKAGNKAVKIIKK